MSEATDVSLNGRMFGVPEMAEDRLGFLVGVRAGDRLDFRYSQLNERGETSKRVRLGEVWSWESKPGEGTSTVEELQADPASA